MTEPLTKTADQVAVRSLAEYAQEHPSKARRCLLCTVPAEIEHQAQQGKAAGVTYRIIGEWLAHLGYADNDHPPTQARLQRHFQDDHTRSAS